MKKQFVLFPLMALLLLGCGNNNSNVKVNKPNSIVMEGDVMNGIKRIYNAEGNLETETPYKDSLPDGLQKEYYKTGQLFRETPLVKGKPNGVVKEYGTKGNLYREMPVVDGKANGVIKKYYDNGVLFSEAPYKNGEPQVGLKEYNEKGQLLEKPKLKFKGIDKTRTEGVYIIEISMTDEYVQPAYSNIVYFDGKEMFSQLPSTNGKASFRIPVPSGTVVNKSFTFEARFNTIRKNIYITRDTYTIGVTNF